MTNKPKEILLSGIRPSGDLHIGNYLGALKQFVELQKEFECFFMIADYHAITTDFEPKELARAIFETVAWYLAAGLNPEKSAIFLQSDVSAHTELAWILTTQTPLGELYRMTQFKEKSGDRKRDSIPAGLLIYPTLMAADILVYRASAVPVGQDQTQHLEFTRDLAVKFNRRFGDVFVEPKAKLTVSKKIMSLTDPTKKMSKTGRDGIALADSEHAIRKKIMAALTDSRGGKTVSVGQMSPGLGNLFCILESFGQIGLVRRFKSEYAAGVLKYARLKQATAESVIAGLAPLQAKYQQIIADPARVRTVLRAGVQKADQTAQKTLNQVKKSLGLIAQPKTGFRYRKID